MRIVLDSENEPSDGVEELLGGGFSAYEDRSPVRVSVKRMPDILLSDGRAVACDAFLREDKPFAQRLPCGPAAVRLVFVEPVHGERHIAFAILGEPPAARARIHVDYREGEDEGDFEPSTLPGFGVDSGTASFASAAVDECLRDRLEDFAKVAAHTSDPLTIETSAGAATIFQAGLGDGYYATFVALDEHGRALAFIIDFGVASWKHNPRPDFFGETASAVREADPARAPSLELRHWIDGRTVELGAARNVTDVVTGEDARVYDGGAAAAKSAWNAAGMALIDSGWSLDGSLRSRALASLRDSFASASAEVDAALKARRASRRTLEQIAALPDRFTYYIDAAAACGNGPATGVLGFVLQPKVAPRGVICSDEAPVLLVFEHIVPPLAAGLPVVVRLGAGSPVASALLVRTIAAASLFPPGIVNLFFETSDDGAEYLRRTAIHSSL